MAKRIARHTSAALIAILLSVWVVKPGSSYALKLTPWQVLLSFQNQDLEKLPKKQSLTLQVAIDRLVGPQAPHEHPFFPRLFQRMNSTTGQARYVLVQEQPLANIPGEARVRTHVFDSAGTPLTTDEFSGGWRTFVKDIAVARNDLLRQDALVVGGHYWIGEVTSHQYYVLVGERMVPAYFELDGKLQRRAYLLANRSIAPSIP